MIGEWKSYPVLYKGAPRALGVTGAGTGGRVELQDKPGACDVVIHKRKLAHFDLDLELDLPCRPFLNRLPLPPEFSGMLASGTICSSIELFTCAARKGYYCFTNTPRASLQPFDRAQATPLL